MWKAPPMPATMPGITNKGPYNPAASLPTRLVLELDFIECPATQTRRKAQPFPRLGSPVGHGNFSLGGAVLSNDRYPGN